MKQRAQNSAENALTWFSITTEEHISPAVELRLTIWRSSGGTGRRSNGHESAASALLEDSCLDDAGQFQAN